MATETCYISHKLIYRKNLKCNIVQEFALQHLRRRVWDGCDHLMKKIRKISVLIVYNGV